MVDSLLRSSDLDGGTAAPAQLARPDAFRSLIAGYVLTADRKRVTGVRSKDLIRHWADRFRGASAGATYQPSTVAALRAAVRLDGEEADIRVPTDTIAEARKYVTGFLRKPHSDPRTRRGVFADAARTVSLAESSRDRRWVAVGRTIGEVLRREVGHGGDCPLRRGLSGFGDVVAVMNVGRVAPACTPADARQRMLAGLREPIGEDPARLDTLPSIVDRLYAVRFLRDVLDRSDYRRLCSRFLAMAERVINTRGSYIGGLSVPLSFIDNATEAAGANGLRLDLADRVRSFLRAQVDLGGAIPDLSGPIDQVESYYVQSVLRPGTAWAPTGDGAAGRIAKRLAALHSPRVDAARKAMAEDRRYVGLRTAASPTTKEDERLKLAAVSLTGWRRAGLHCDARAREYWNSFVQEIDRYSGARRLLPTASTLLALMMLLPGSDDCIGEKAQSRVVDAVWRIVRAMRAELPESVAYVVQDWSLAELACARGARRPAGVRADRITADRVRVIASEGVEMQFVDWRSLIGMTVRTARIIHTGCRGSGWM